MGWTACSTSRKRTCNRRPVWRFPRFLRFGNNGDTTAQPKARKPPQEPEERKHQFAVWYVFAAFLGLMLIQYVWLVFAQVETIPYSQFEQLLNENKIPKSWSDQTLSKAR